MLSSAVDKDLLSQPAMHTVLSLVTRGYCMHPAASLTTPNNINCNVQPYNCWWSDPAMPQTNLNALQPRSHNAGNTIKATYRCRGEQPGAKSTH